jgi:RNA polymerase sigma-70 factor (ECF subfamily)
VDSHAQPPAAETILQHAQFVRALARQLLAGDESAADDLAQDALLKYVESPPRNPLDPRAWFARVVRNLAHNTRRSQAHRELREQRAARSERTASADEPLLHAAMLRSVVDAVLSLDEPYRSTIVARYYQGHAPARIASDTETPLATVKSRLARAHESLRARLDREHGSRDAWGLALGSLVDVPVVSTSIAMPLFPLIAAALVIVGVSFGTWRFLRRDVLQREERIPAVAGSASSTVPTTLQEKLPGIGGSAREVITATPLLRGFVVDGTLSNTAYAPLDIAAGAAAGVSLEIRLVTERNGTGDTLAQVRAVTAADGAFHAAFEGLSATSFLLSISAPADDTWRELLFEAAPREPRAWEGLALARAAHGVLEGAVVDPSGLAVSGLALRLSSQQSSQGVEVRSGEQGLLRTPFAGHLRRVESLDREWTLLRITRPQDLPQGGASGLQVVAAQAASMRVKIVDALGAGVEGVNVRVALASAEVGEEESFSAMTSHSRTAATDSAGTVRIEDLWSGHKLRVTLEDQASVTSSGVRDGELVFGDDAQAAAPIVLAPGEERELRATWNGMLRIEGSVLRVDQTPANVAEVRVFDLGAEPGALRSLIRARTDHDGAFALTLRERTLIGPLLVQAGELATDPPTNRKLRALGYADGTTAVDASRGELELDLARAVDGKLTASIVLKPLLSISGQVLSAAGLPFENARSRVSLECERAAVGARSRSDTREPDWKADGRFELSGLEPGPWNLRVTQINFPTFYSWPSNAFVVEGVEAGTTGLEIRMREPEQVRVHVRIVGAKPDAVVALRGKLTSSASQTESALAPSHVRIDAASSWPLQAPLRFGGISGGRDQLGTWSYGFDSYESTLEFELPAMDPGVYVIGAQLFADGGQTRWFPQASTPLRFAAGEYEVEFDAIGTASLEGCVTGDLGARRFGVAICDANGARLPLESAGGSGRPEDVREVDARGRFRLDHAPLGNWRLRAGTLAQLAQGSFQVELPIEIKPDGNPAIELHL